MCVSDLVDLEDDLEVNNIVLLDCHLTEQDPRHTLYVDIYRYFISDMNMNIKIHLLFFFFASLNQQISKGTILF